MPAKSYEFDELLQAQPSAKVTADVVRRINQSEAGIRAEHVLRDVSNGSDPTCQRSRPRSSSIVTNPYEDLPNDDLNRPRTRNRSGKYSKYSPTPSIKRGKAEKLLKEHGSPPGVRVTAGGRIVPNGTSPIITPRFVPQAPFNKFQAFTRFGRAAPVDSVKLLDGYVIDLGNGSLGQLIDGQLRPVGTRDGILHLYMPAPNLPLQPSGPAFGPFGNPSAFQAFPTAGGMSFNPLPGPAPSAAPPSGPLNQAGLARELCVMEEVHAKLEQELKDLDRGEVLQRDSLNPTTRTEIVRRRVELVNRIDESRRGVVEAKRLANEKPNGETTSAPVPAYPGFGVLGPSHIHFDPISTMDPYYNVGPQMDSPTSYEQALYGMPQFLPSLQAFAPLGPEFAPAGMPQYHSLPSHSQFQPERMNDTADLGPPALQERAGNAGMGQAVTANRETRTSTEIAKVSYPSNLDGSSHQPRRSHAVEIKKPQDLPEQTTSKSFLNPTSPSYLPSQITSDGTPANDDDKSVFMPSPTLVAQMDNLVQSPTLSDRAAEEHGSSQHTSDGSATTGDFFPQDPKQHSSTKYMYPGHDPHVNMPAWFGRGASSSQALAMRGTAGVAKPSWAIGDDNLDGTSGHMRPEHANPINAAARQPSADFSPNHAAHSCDMDFITQAAFMHISPGTKRQQSAHLRESTITNEDNISTAMISGEDPVSDLLRKASEQVADMQPEHGKSAAYWGGFRTGMKRALAPDNVSEAYREGYRDGLINSIESTTPTAATGAAFALPYETFGKQTLHPTAAQTLSIAPGHWNPTTTKSDMLQYTIPGPPQNSVSSTPATSRSAKKRSPSGGLTLDSPQAQADFMAQPNINVSARVTPTRATTGTQTSGSSLRGNSEHPPSPLANRQLARLSASKPQPRNIPLDQQRFRKAKPSVAQTNDPAHAHISGQSDASKDDEKAKIPHAEAGLALIPMSPPMSPRSKGRSPVKSAATAAVASIAQLARTGVKKEQEPTRMSSPEKRAWRAKWMGGKKVDEQHDIDAFKKKFADM